MTQDNGLIAPHGGTLNPREVTGGEAQALADKAKSAVVQREIGSSDHGPVVVEFQF